MATKVLPILAARPSENNSVCSTATSQKVRKRKTPPHVSANACTNCKRARSKCDGDAATTCSRCISREMAGTCRFELSIKASKQELLDKIGELENQLARLQEDSCQSDTCQIISPTRSTFQYQLPPSVKSVRRLSAPMMRRDILANAKANSTAPGSEARHTDVATRIPNGPASGSTMDDFQKPRACSRTYQASSHAPVFDQGRSLPSRPHQRKRTEPDVMKITGILNGGC